MGGEVVRMFSGVVLIVVGIAWYFVRVPVLSDVLSTGTLVPFWRALLAAFAACFGIAMLIAGLVIAWIGYDDYREKRRAEA